MAKTWSRESIEKLSPGEIRSLGKNARERGALDVADLCDEVLKSKFKAAVDRARQEAPPKRKSRLVSRKKAMEMRGVKLHNPYWSWGGIRPTDGIPVLTIWHDEIAKTDTGFECFLWGPNVDGSRPWADSNGGRERLEHCRVGAEVREGEGVLIYGQRRGRDLPVEKASKVEGADPHTVIRFQVEVRGGEYWAVWERSLPPLDSE